MKISKILGITLIIATAFNACGGGSSGSNDDLNVSGTWRGALTRLQSTCPTTADAQTVNFTHTVSQNEQAVTLVTSDGVRYLGNVLGGEGFSVDSTATGQFQGSSCSLIQNIQYDRISNDSDETADVEFRVTRQCANGTTCEVTYTGAATRPITTTNTPAPGATTTPIVAGVGCGAIAERSFSGDGGCGISTTSVDQTGTSNLLLTPFGANGATSFVIDAANTSTAASNRNDLTIKSEGGYSCSITCSPPLSFTVSCFREGGTVCRERF